MNSVLVVCEGNICRSPMAAGLLRAELPLLDVRSAGLGALIGHPADDTAVDLLRQRGIDIKDHRATQISRQSCLGADLVLVMDDMQRNRVETLYPQARGRVRKVGEFIERDIPDPYRQPVEAFKQALALIDQGLQQWLARIRKF